MESVAAASFPGRVSFELATVPSSVQGDWGNYARGAALALQKRGHDLSRGLVGVTNGDPGMGGLSSSAAVGVAYLLGLILFTHFQHN